MNVIIVSHTWKAVKTDAPVMIREAQARNKSPTFHSTKLELKAWKKEEKETVARVVHEECEPKDSFLNEFGPN